MTDMLMELYEELAKDKDRVYVHFQGERYVNGSKELFEAVKQHIDERR